MTKITKVALVALLALTMAVPVFAWGPGGGRVGGMMGRYNRAPGYNQQYYNNTLTQEQQTQLNALQKKFYDETTELRNQMWAKSNELNTILNSTDPDAAKVKALQNEINDLRAKISEAGIDYDLEAKKINPEAYGTRGVGPRMGGFGRGMGTFGPGAPYCF